MRTPTTLAANAALWLAAILIVAPLVSIGLALATTPAAWRLLGEGHAWSVHATTLAFACAAATLALPLAMGPAAWLRRGGGVRLSIAVALALAVLATPEAAWAYGVAEAWRLTVGMPAPDTALDRVRAVTTTAAQVWPVPAAVWGIALRRLPTSLLEAADLDGGRRRMTLRLLAPPTLAAWAGALLLAGRQVSAYDQTGIVTSSVLVRDAYVLALGGVDDRMAAAAANGAPVMAVLAIVAMAAWWLWRRESAELDDDGQARLRAVGPQLPWTVFSWGLVLGSVAVPLAALWQTAGERWWAYAVEGYRLQWENSMLVACLAGGAAFTLASLGLIVRPRWALVASVGVFLLGGQLVSLGLLRLLNDRPSLQLLAWAQDGVYALIYNRLPIFAWPSLALFAWLPLAAAAATWSGRGRRLRELAAADGATRLQAARLVIWPTFWPGLLAAGVAVVALAFGETAAAVLLYPDTLVNAMMTNVHTLAYPAMAQSALLGALTVAAVAIIATLIWTIGKRMKDEGRRMNPKRLLLIGFILLPSSFILSAAFILSGCDAPAQPVATYSSIGTGEGQVVYPRAIAYSKAEDALWVIDRTARVQKFDAATGEFVLGWAMPENVYGRPVGVSVDGEGNVWVPDTHYGRVIVFDPTGDELFRFGETGTDPGQFVWPTDVLVLDDNRVLVSEYGAGEAGNNDRIQLWRRGPNGTMTAERVIGSFGTDHGQFRRPQSMARVHDELWVADAANHRLVVFSLRDDDFGVFLRNAAEGAVRFPYGLDVDGEGNLLVAEFGNNRVSRVDADTGFVTATWGSFGGAAGQLRYPWAVAFDSERDQTVIVDSGNDRLQIVDF